MAGSTGLVLAAGAIAAANQTVFAPVAEGRAPNILTDFNWRIVPATAVLALTLAGLGKAAPQFARALGGLVLLAVLIVPTGNAPTPIESIAKVVG